MQDQQLTIIQLGCRALGTDSQAKMTSIARTDDIHVDRDSPQGVWVRGQSNNGTSLGAEMST